MRRLSPLFHEDAQRPDLALTERERGRYPFDSWLGSAYPENRMESDLTADQEALVRRAAETTDASMARGEGRNITKKSVRQLGNDARRRGRRRLLLNLIRNR